MLFKDNVFCVWCSSVDVECGRVGEYELGNPSFEILNESFGDVNEQI